MSERDLEQRPEGTTEEPGPEGGSTAGSPGGGLTGGQQGGLTGGLATGTTREGTADEEAGPRERGNGEEPAEPGMSSGGSQGL